MFILSYILSVKVLKKETRCCSSAFNYQAMWKFAKIFERKEAYNISEARNIKLGFFLLL